MKYQVIKTLWAPSGAKQTPYEMRTKVDVVGEYDTLDDAKDKVAELAKKRLWYQNTAKRDAKGRLTYFQFSPDSKTFHTGEVKIERIKQKP